MACIVKTHHLKVLFKEMQFIASFIFHMGKTRMQVKNDLRCLRQKKDTLYNSVHSLETVPKPKLNKSTRLTILILKQLQCFKNRKIMLLDSHIPLHRKSLGMKTVY